MVDELWVDGGVVTRNPSPLAGSWAWIAVENDKIVARKSGLLLPEKVGCSCVSNNQTELYAAIKALEHYPDFDGILFTDSDVTRKRLTNRSSFKNIPQWMRDRAFDLTRCREWSVELVAGHPTKLELLTGVRVKNGLKASKYNKICDEMCRKQARKFLREMENGKVD